MGAVDEKAKNSCPGTGHGTGCGKTKRILELINSFLMSVRARRFQLTLNEPEKYEAIKKLLGDFKYLISCREDAPTTGHKHIHIYVCYSSPRRMKDLMGAHIEMCRGSNKQNISYIRKKEDIIEEIGEPPTEGGSRMAVDLVGLPKEEVRVHEVNAWLKMNSATHMTKEECYKPEVEVTYIWGDSAAGKSKYVYNHIEGASDRDWETRITDDRGL